MQSRIPKILISLALAAPVSYGLIHAARTEGLSGVSEILRFFSDIPKSVSDAVASFKTLPERMNPTLSECN
jgi:hypothetical protein